MLPEREQFVRNLFISAQSKDYQQNYRRRRIVSPDFIRIILQDAAKEPLPIRRQLIDVIGKFFEQNHDNSLILNSKDLLLADQSLSILDEWVAFMLRSVETQQDIERYAELLGSLTCHYNIGLRNIAALTRQLGRDYHLERFNELRFRFATRAINVPVGSSQKFFMSKPQLRSQPLNYFYFYGPESGVRLHSSDIKWPFQQHLSLVLCFSYLASKEPGHLFSLESSRQQHIDIYVSHNSLRCQLFSAQIELAEVRPGCWYMFSFEYDLLTGRIQGHLNQQPYSRSGLPVLKPDTQRQLSHLVFGSELQGKLSSIVVFTGPLHNQCFFKEMPFGIESWPLLKQVRQKKLFESAMLSYLPFVMFSTQQYRDSCFDFIRRNHGELLQNSTIYDSRFSSQSICRFGGLRIVLPLFYLIRIDFSDLEFYPDRQNTLLKEVLSLVLALFQHKFAHVEKDALECDFLPTMAMHINKLGPRYLTLQLINMLRDLKSAIHDTSLKEQYFNHVLWGLKVHLVKDPPTIQAIYRLILSNYQINITFYQAAFGVQAILYSAIRNFEGVSTSCCAQHYINQTLLDDRPLAKHIKQLGQYQYALHLRYIEEIVVYILNEQLKQDYRSAVTQVKFIFRLLLQKHTSCFYLSLIRIAKKVLRVGQDTRGAQAELLLREFNVLGYLYHLCEKTINPDIISSVLDIVFFLYNRFRRYLDQHKVMSFVLSLFRKLPPFLYMSPRSQSKVALIKDIRKKSVDVYDRQFTVYPRSHYRNNSIDRRMSGGSRPLSIQDVRYVIPIKPETLANSMEVYNSIRRFSCLKNFDQDNIVVDNEDVFKVMSEFYRVALPQLKQIILVEVLALIKLSQQNATFLQNSSIFNMFMVRILSQEYHEKPVSYQMALKVLAELFQSNTANKKMFGQHYVLVKSCTQIIEKEAGTPIDVLQAILLELLRRSTLESEVPYELLSLLTEQVYCELLECQADAARFERMRPLFERSLQTLYAALSAQLSYLTQDYFESSTIFASIIDSKYHSPAREYLLKEISSTTEQDVIMIFDNFVNRSLTKPTVEVEAIVRKKTYIIEAYLDMLKNLIVADTSKEPVLEERSARLDHNLKILTKLTVAFVCLLTNQATKQSAKLDNNVLGRKVVMQVCHFLYSQHDAAVSTKPLYEHYLLKLFQFVFEYLDYIDNVLGRHDNFGKLLQRLSGLSRTHYNPFLIELFEFFIRNEQNKPLLSLIDVANLVKYQFSYLKETIMKGDFSFCFNRPTLKQVIGVCHAKDIEEFRGQHSKLVAVRRERLEYDIKDHDYQAVITQEILQLFDSENPAEEKARISFISRQEKSLRRTMQSWSRSWKHLRLYDKPYGIWMDQRDVVMAHNLKKGPISPYKNIRQRVSKYTCSNVRSRPMMECSIIQPWHIIKKKYEDKAEHMLNINMLPRKNLVEGNKYTIKDIFLFRFVKARQADKDDKSYRVIWIKDSIKIKGFVHLYHDYLFFQYDGVTQADSHLSFSQFRLEVFNRLYKKWYYVDIAKLIRRRYLMKYSCIEVLMCCHSSILLDFESPVLLDQFLQDINNIRKNRLAKCKQLLTLNKVQFFTEDFLTDMPSVNLLNTPFMEAWRQRRISNLQYLLVLNELASRNFHDYSQYPVFPWIVEMGTSKSPQLRDLSKTMGGLGSLERIETLREKYNSEDPFNPVPKFYYGTHYSSPGVVFNYLIRLSPFTECCKQLQGGKFDLPDRMFFSMISSWKSAIKEMSDVRELIPEFYYLPEAFLNRQGLNLGAMQSGQVVDDVELPVWAANAYHFVTQLRQILESEEVSTQIHNWIDLVFGYKQKGKEAEANMNVFYYLTYEDGIKLEEIKDEVHRTSCEAQIIHFGQTPSQLLDRPHPVRDRADKHHFQLVVRRNVKLPSREVLQEPIGSYEAEGQLTLVFKNRLVSYTLGKDSITSKQVFEIQFQRSLCNVSHNVAKTLSILQSGECRTSFFCEGRYLIVSGYVDCSYRVYRTVNGEIVADGHASSRISCLLVSQAEDLLLIGTEGGSLQIVEIKHESPSTLSLKLVHEQYFEQRVQHISQKQNFFAISYGDYVAIYRFTRSLQYLVDCKPQRKPKVKFFRSLKNRSRVNGCILVESPLFGLVIYDNLGIKCYGANGQLLAYVTTSTSVNELVLVRDSSLHDIIVYLEEDKLIGLSTPDLRRISMVDIPQPTTFTRGLLIGRADGVLLYGAN